MARQLSEDELVQTYRQTIRPLYAYVSRRVGGDAGLAEDLVQDTWMRALEAGLEAFHRKIDIRQRFLKGEFDAAVADLRMLEGDAEQRRKALVPKLELAKKAVARVEVRIKTGLAQPVERSEAQVRVMELETELARLDLELAVVRRQIERRGR